MDADYIDARFVRVNRRPFRTPHPQPLTPRAHLRIATVYPVTGYSASYGRHSPLGLVMPGTPPRSYGVPGYGLIRVLRTPQLFWLAPAGHTSAELRCTRLWVILRPADATSLLAWLCRAHLCGAPVCPITGYSASFRRGSL